jgi:hypothetical protein
MTFMSAVGTASTAASHVGLAILLLAMWHYAVQGGVNTIVGFVEPEQARAFVLHLVNMFVGNASVRDLNATHVFLFALILLAGGVITLVDDALQTFKIALSEKTLVPVELVQKAPNATYDQAISLTGAAAKKKRAPLK